MRDFVVLEHERVFVVVDLHVLLALHFLHEILRFHQLLSDHNQLILRLRTCAIFSLLLLHLQPLIILLHFHQVIGQFLHLPHQFFYLALLDGVFIATGSLFMLLLLFLRGELASESIDLFFQLGCLEISLAFHCFEQQE